jgi:hypothetical protein
VGYTGESKMVKGQWAVKGSSVDRSPFSKRIAQEIASREEEPSQNEPE